MEYKTQYRLEMASSDDLRPKRTDVPGLEIRRVEVPTPELNWFLHQCVGQPHRWGGREDWGREDWSVYVDRHELETWVAYMKGSPAGYFELERQQDQSVRMQCFGLFPRFVAQGIGGPFLTAAVERAWAMGAERVWLETCSHDHAHAIPNYTARGFKVIAQTKGPANPSWDSRLFG